MQKVLNRTVVPSLVDLLDHPDTVDMVLPSVLAVIELLSPEDYNSLVRSEIKKLLNSASSVQVNCNENNWINKLTANLAFVAWRLIVI